MSPLSADTVSSSNHFHLTLPRKVDLHTAIYAGLRSTLFKFFALTQFLLFLPTMDFVVEVSHPMENSAKSCSARQGVGS